MIRCLLLLLLMAASSQTLCLAQTAKQTGDRNKANHKEAESVEQGQRLFTLKVLPLFRVKCFGCHGQDREDIRGDYNMLTREQLLAGGESGDAALIPGHPEKSPLMSAILWEDLEMPPKENDRLTEEEIEFVRRWIEAGAPWPDEKKQKQIRQQEQLVPVNEDGALARTSGGLSDDWTYRRYKPGDLWAFRPVRKPEVPRGTKAVNPIDAFLNRKLKEAGLQPAPTADPRTLIRRVTYDLIGLPPKPDETERFLAAWEIDPEQAWEELVDRLLASDHYGERWAQHWLDVVRYADTAGFSNDYERSNAWRYRDYVIRSFNKDKPYNEFVKEQIAGDELRPGDPEALIATGFLRMGPWGTAMIPQPEARQIYLDDLVHNVGQTFMSIPMRCCKCHDHKFDPVPTQDYYNLYAVFAATQPAEMKADFLPEENRNGFAEKKKLVEELLAYARAKRDEVYQKQEAAAKKWYAEHGLPYKDENARRNDPEDKKPPRHVGLTPEEKGIKKVREQDVWIWERRMERFEPLAQAVYNGQDDWKNSRKLRPPKKINRNWRPASFVLGGGSLTSRVRPARPGVLSAPGLPTEYGRSHAAEPPFSLPDGLEGRRLALARWLTDPRNPLTTRSIVNRIWQYHFGTGLVKTSNNFGAKGARPSHPELLDWLTHDFVSNGWTFKRMHRMIVLSQAYRRSSTSTDPEKQNRIDPENRLLAAFPVRRLTAEEIRDSLLQITGELNPELGGLPIMPEINMEVALQPRMIQFSIAPAHQPSRTPQERNRRTIYAYRVRGQADPFLEILNLPNPNESCARRDAAAVTPQAFTLLNSDVMNDRSIALALRILRNKTGSSDTADWVRDAFEMTFQRSPSVKELGNLKNYLEKMRAYHREHQPEKIEYPTQVQRSLVEELTGQPFYFMEKLNVFEDYVPDAKPWTVDADTRALADLCLVLFNTNEFIYVY